MKVTLSISTIFIAASIAHIMAWTDVDNHHVDSILTVEKENYFDNYITARTTNKNEFYQCNSTQEITIITASTKTSNNTNDNDNHGRIDYTEDEVPSYIKTRFIKTKYRAHLTLQQCFKSMFQLHNETLQIWTHLLPALFFWYKLYQCWLLMKHNNNNKGKLLSLSPSSSSFEQTFGLLCCCWAVVFSASYFAHTFNPLLLGKDWFWFCWKVDWCAISFAAYGVLNTLVTLSFHDNIKQKMIWQRIFLVSCLIVLVCTSTEAFHHLPQWLKLSVWSFPAVSFVSFVVTLVISKYYDVSPSHNNKNRFLTIVFKQVVLVPMVVGVVGSLAYGAEFPERYFQTINFDLTRGHHVIHHLWSATFALLFYRNTLAWYYWNESSYKGEIKDYYYYHNDNDNNNNKE